MFISCSSMLATSSVQAQNDSIDYHFFHRELYKSTSFAISSKIASDIIDSNAEKYSDIGVKYTGEFGSYHKVQTAQNVSRYVFDAEGALVTEKSYMSGGFHFSEDFKRSVRFNSIIDPYRGTPYMLADSTNSNWKIQNYSMWTKLAHQILPERLSIGLNVSLDVARGAKMIDPRPRSNNSNIAAMPSLSLQLGRHKVGAAFDYKSFKEVTNMILYNSSESQKVYAFKGLGQYTFDIFSTTERERKYDGSGVGGVLTYHYVSDAFSFFTQGEYDNYAEEVSDIENSKPRLRGRYYSDKYNLTLKAKYKSGKAIHILSFNYSNNKQSGREIIQFFNSSPDVNAWQTDSEAPGRWKGDKKSLNVTYDFSLLNKAAYYSPLGARISYTNYNFSEKYRVMETHLSYKNNIFSFVPYYNVKLSSKLIGSAKLIAEYFAVSDLSSSYKERETDNHTVKEMYFDKEMSVLSQNYYLIGGELGCGYTFMNGAVLMLNASYKYLNAAEGLYRHYPTVTLSYHF